MTLPLAGLSATLLIGTYTGSNGPAGPSKGLYAASWDGKTGTLGPLRLFAELKHPTFLVQHPSLPLVYAVSEIEQFDGKPTGAVVAYRPDGTVAGTWPSHGTSPCHLATDPRGEFLVISNYSSGSAAVYPLVQGLPAADAQVLQGKGTGPNRGRQEGPHAHSGVFDRGGDRFWIQDLGTDRLCGFRLDRTARTAAPLVPASTQVAPGAGPRHLTFHATGPWAYVINELDSTVTALTQDAATGALTPIQTVRTRPADVPDKDYNDCADIHISPDGAYLYGSNRGHNSLAVWRIAPEDGRLTLVQHMPSGGGHPRNFTLSPDGGWLLCANRDSDNIVVFRRDARTGRLERAGEFAAPHPVCLQFVRPGLDLAK